MSQKAISLPNINLKNSRVIGGFIWPLKETVQEQRTKKELQKFLTDGQQIWMVFSSRRIPTVLVPFFYSSIKSEVTSGIFNLCFSLPYLYTASSLVDFMQGLELFKAVLILIVETI